MNILFHIYKTLEGNDPELMLVNIPIEGELIQYREILGNEAICDFNIPTDSQGLPLQRLLWRMCGQARFIPWRLSRNMDEQNRLYDLNIEAQIHPHSYRSPDRGPAQAEPSRDEEELAVATDLPRDPRYGLDFICDPDRSPEALRQDEELVTAMYLAAVGGAECDMPLRRPHDPPGFQSEYHDPAGEYTSMDSGKRNKSFNRIAAVPDNRVTPHQQGNMYDQPMHSYNQAYNRYGYDTGEILPVSQYPEFRGNAYCVSEQSQYYEGTPDAVSALGDDDYQVGNHGCFDPPPPVPSYPAYNAPEPDSWPLDVRTRATESSLVQSADTYEKRAPNTHRNVIPRRPVPDRSYHQPESAPLHTYLTRPEDYHGYFSPELAHSETSAGCLEAAEGPELMAQLHP